MRTRLTTARRELLLVLEPGQAQSCTLGRPAGAYVPMHGAYRNSDSARANWSIWRI